MESEITLKEAIQVLKVFNEWRRGAEIPQPDPKIIGIAIDTVIEYSEKSSKTRAKI